MRLREGKIMSHATKATYSLDAALMAVYTPRSAPRMLVLVGDEANLSKFDQIIEEIEGFRAHWW